MGFAMVAYPTSLIFRVARTIENALAGPTSSACAGSWRRDEVDPRHPSDPSPPRCTRQH
jgi:hypothetical protein